MDREIQDQFGAVAANYVTSAVHARGEDLPLLVEAAGLAGHESVLDLGTAVGHTAFTFAPRVERVTGVDLTDEMLAQARELASARRVENVRFVRADVSDLPFDRASFDLVTSRYSAHHYANPREVGYEIARVLRPGGRVVLADTVAPEDPAMDTFINAVELLRDRSHVRDHSIAQWRAILAEAGLASEVYQTWDLSLDFEEWVARMRTPSDAVALLRSLLVEAPRIARETFQIRSRDRLTFCLKCAIIRAWPAAL
ncbi:MAG: class I SAM-dependent methyltransferase [Chloroflexota bacterium]